MQTKILTIGKIKNREILLQIEDLKKRISRLEFIELKEVKEKNTNLLKKKECELIKEYLTNNTFNILLHEEGKQYDTHELYAKMNTLDKPILFIITGAFGPNDKLKNLVDMNLSLSKLTFTHEMAKLLLIEQIYRFECFDKNIPYTK